MRRIGVGVAVVLTLALVGGAVALGLGAGGRASGPTVRIRAPSSDPERRVTRFGPGDPRQGSRPEGFDPAAEPAPAVRRVDGPPKPVDPVDRDDPNAVPAEDPEGDVQPAEVVRHPMDVAGIREAVRSQQPELKACYDTLLASYPDAAGRIVATFEIGPDGSVQAADIEDATFDSVYLEGCIVTALEDVRFEPAADGGSASVTYPFVFRASD